ncbi:iron uptake transporter deferrochelatase/peroxidase subunit [Paenibacillus macerans]|uniref:iron uptake transporter deferrochelatase/peroxidase subunit n=1 Tax=Paenibacillus macerans TaxID=44252 RepID=UPI003D310B1D
MRKTELNSESGHGNRGRSEASAEAGGGLLDKRFSRRELLKIAGAGGIGLLLGGGGAYGMLAAKEMLAKTAPKAGVPSGSLVPFHGGHQAGIVTPAQNFLCFAAFDLTTRSLSDVRKLFQAWTEAAAAMTEGMMIGSSNDNLNLPPSDTGEAAGLSPSRLTLTFGVGPSFFDGRFGLSGQRPASFSELPSFRGDALLPEWCGGDLAVQVCADDMQVAFHAVRNLARIGRGTAVLRWMQEGFQRTGPADPAGGTPRNLMGFKDGTGNPDIADAAAMNESVWVQAVDGAGWMRGGSYMAIRRIRMRIEVWDRSSLADQEQTFGRHRGSGAPLGSKDEFAPLDLDAKDASGQPVLPMTSHSRLAHMDGKLKILRRAYSYTGGMDAKTGQLDAGLIFISYQRNLQKQFVPMQQTLAQSDKLNEYILHVGSAVFACFPGIREGGYIGETLF